MMMARHQLTLCLHLTKFILIMNFKVKKVSRDRDVSPYYDRFERRVAIPLKFYSRHLRYLSLPLVTVPSLSPYYSSATQFISGTHDPGEFTQNQSYCRSLELIGSAQ